MHQSKTTPSTVHDDAYWDKLWDRQEKVIEQAKTPIKLRDNGRAKPINFLVREEERQPRLHAVGSTSASGVSVGRRSCYR